VLSDLLGCEIKAGARIAWPNRRGSAMWINVGAVQYIHSWYSPTKGIRMAIDVWLTHSRGQEVGKVTTLHDFNNIVVLELPEPKLEEVK